MTPPPPRIGVFYPARRPLDELVPTARAAEAGGFDSFWVAEDCFLAGGLAAAATVLAVTESIDVGLGLLPAAVRNPAIAAMEIATLGSLHPGRFSAVFGHGVSEWMRQIGAAPRRRLKVLGETVAAVRGLLHGEELDCDGELFALRHVALEAPPESPPEVLVGTTGPRGIAIAAAVADGLVLPEGAGVEAVAAAAASLGPKPLVVYAWMRIHDDGERAREELIPTVRTWCRWGVYERQMDHAGLASDSIVDAAAVARVSVAGDAAECADAITALGAAGASSVVIVPTETDALAQLGRFAAEVLPRFNRRR
jgi:alkanesulfonate monooxygenase SsuD/methylene tetrahydromethanopterin reductase-like flavin-dependent oxidoreductase (luciferase family)